MCVWCAPNTKKVAEICNLNVNAICWWKVELRRNFLWPKAYDNFIPAENMDDDGSASRRIIQIRAKKNKRRSCFFVLYAN